MPEVESRFSVSEELATSVYRGLPIRSGLGGHQEQRLRRILDDHLGLGSTGTTSPRESVTGILLTNYAIASARLAGILAGEDHQVVRESILRSLTIRPGESPQQTFERLLNAAMDNSCRINSSIR